MAFTRYYYVKSGGTAATTGGYTGTQRTGAWTATTSDYWDSIWDVITNATVTPTDNDVIICSDAHAFNGTVGAHLTMNSGGAFDQEGLYIVSVDNANQENYKPGASEVWTDAYYRDLRYNGVIAGVSMGSAYTAGLFYCNSWRWTMSDMTITPAGTNSYAIWGSSSGTDVTLMNVDIDTGSNNASVCRMQGGRLKWLGGSLLSSGGSVSVLSSSLAAGGGVEVDIIGVDLTEVGEISNSNLNGSAIDNYALIKFTNCLYNTTDPTLRTLATTRTRFEFTNSDETSATAGIQHRFWIQDGAGKVVNNQTTKITADPTINETASNSFSMEVTTTALCSAVHPFIFTLPADYADFGATASDILTLEITTDQVLDNADLVAYLIYPDGTNLLQANIVTNAASIGTGNFGVDPLALASSGDSATTLATSSLGAGDWASEPVSPNFYKIDLDTSGDAGEGAAFEIRVEVRMPSILAGELFISPFLSQS